MKTGLQATLAGLLILAMVGLLLFLPAGTFNYWQAWVFIAILTLSSGVLTIYLGLRNPAALQRRMQGGPGAETRTAQKCISAITLLSLPAMMLFSVFDHRFGWSPVPLAVSLLGDVLVVIGIGLTGLVVIQNSYAAANITVEAGQKLTTTGLYGLVRHPMYVGVLLMLLGVPLALDSWWGLIFLILDVIAFVLRILDEERMLKQELDGYNEYIQKVHYRLMPYIW